MLVASPLPRIEAPDAPAELGDEMLMACRRGDRSALTRFVKCYEHRVFAYLSRCFGATDSIEDLAQEVFVRAYQALARFETGGTAKLSTWVLTIAHRVVIDARRRQRSVARGEMELLDERVRSHWFSPEQLLGHDDLRRAIASAVAELPDEQRDVFVLAEFHDLSTAAIAGVVGAPEATVKTRLFRARTRLRTALAFFAKELP